MGQNQSAPGAPGGPPGDQQGKDQVRVEGPPQRVGTLHAARSTAQHSTMGAPPWPAWPAQLPAAGSAFPAVPKRCMRVCTRMHARPWPTPSTHRPPHRRRRSMSPPLPRRVWARSRSGVTPGRRSGPGCPPLRPRPSAGSACSSWSASRITC